MPNRHPALAQKERVQAEGQRDQQKGAPIGDRPLRTQGVKSPARAGEITERGRRKPKAIVHPPTKPEPAAPRNSLLGDEGDLALLHLLAPAAQVGVLAVEHLERARILLLRAPFQIERAQLGLQRRAERLQLHP